MKKIIKSKNSKISFFAIFFVIINVFFLQNIFTKKKQCYFCNNKEIDIVEDAANSIQKKLNKETDRIVRTYKVVGNDLSSVRTKVYHKTYRKKPDCFSEDFTNKRVNKQNAKNTTIEFIYKSYDKNYLTQILRENKNKKIQKIDFSSFRKGQCNELLQA